MLLKVQGIGKQKLKYKDHANIEFDDLNSYIVLAKKAISKFSNSICSGISSKMLKDEDAISSIANAIMMADWRWDSDYQSKTGTQKTRYSYRNQCAIWAIQTYISKNFTKSKKINKVYSLDEVVETDGSCNNYSFVADLNSPSPEDILIANEEYVNLNENIKALLNLQCLTDRQKDYIKLYYFENYTFEKIGQKYNITREAVRQGLNKAIETIRSYINE
jgi:RNA polymerase sigma factor (sigma-70 family)